MSDRLEDINVPIKLLNAIRNEVRSTSEQQLNDLWMVVHSLKDSAGGISGGPGAGPSAHGAELDQIKESVSQIQKTLKALADEQMNLRVAVEEIGPSTDRKLRGLRRKVVEQMSGEMPALPAGLTEKLEQLESMKSRSEKAERDLAQVGGAAALLETRLYDLENRLMRRVEAVENRPVASTAPMSSSSGYDQLSDEALMAQPSAVNFQVDDLLKVVLKYEGSDLFLKSNALPYTSLSGELVPIGKQILNTEDCRRLILLALTVPKRRELIERRSVQQLASWHETVFRICAYFERDRISASIQRVATHIPSLEDLGVPRSLELLSLEESGLILVVAPPHSSRHETLISLLQHVNRNRKVRLFSLEDKIHYELADAEALVTQQEVGADVPDLAGGLAALRMLQPDGVMVSLLQDASAANQLLELANGHCLTLVGIEANRAIEGLEALLALVPAERKAWALDVLGRQLKAVVAQNAVARLDGQGTVLATELLLNNEESNEFISEGHLRLLEPIMERNLGGMHSLKTSLRKLSESGLIRPNSGDGANTADRGKSSGSVGGLLRRERGAGDSPRLEPPPMIDEVPLVGSGYALSSPPPPVAAPVSTPPVKAPAVPEATPPVPAALPTTLPQPALTPPTEPNSDQGDDALMGWL